MAGLFPASAHHRTPSRTAGTGVTMNDDLFARLCDELGYDPSVVLVIRVGPREADVTYTEPSGMPRGARCPLDQQVDDAA